MNALRIHRIWEDVDFYEVSISIKGIDINVTMPLYLNDEILLQLSKAMHDVGYGEVDDYHWECGEDIENVSSYGSMRIYRLNEVGRMAIDFILDNKLKKPHWKRTQFSIVTEANSLIEFAEKIELFTNENLNVIEGIYLRQ